MKVVVEILQIFLCILLFINAGCEQPTLPPGSSVKTDNDFNSLSVCINYAPEKIDILPLTELISISDARHAQINLYVSLLDPFGSQIKSPGIFRFELYEYVQRSAKPKGKRIVLWPDVDLSEPAQNNEKWRDFLRTYEFNLPFEQAANRSYILQVTCLCPNGRRLSSEFTLKNTK
jgi:hypothetical protein